MKKSFSDADELDGFDELEPADQDRIRKAWDEGCVPDEDVPETARKPEKADDEEKPRKKRAPSKKDDEADVAKPKKARTSKKVRRRCPCFTFSALIPLTIHRSPMKMVSQRMTTKKKKSQRKHPHQSLVPRQTFPTSNFALKRADSSSRKPKMTANK